MGLFRDSTRKIFGFKPKNPVKALREKNQAQRQATADGLNEQYRQAEAEEAIQTEVSEAADRDAQIAAIELESGVDAPKERIKAEGDGNVSPNEGGESTPSPAPEEDSTGKMKGAFRNVDRDEQAYNLADSDREAGYKAHKQVDPKVMEAALSHEPLDGIVNVARTDSRNTSMLGQVSEDTYNTALRAAFLKAKKERVEKTVNDFEPELRDELLKHNWMDRVLEKDKELGGQKKRIPKTREMQQAAAHKVVGFDKVKWLDKEMADPKSPINDKNHDVYAFPNTPSAVAYRKAHIAALNSTLSLADIGNRGRGLTDELMRKREDEDIMGDIVLGQMGLFEMQLTEMYEESVRMIGKGGGTSEEKYNLLKGLTNAKATTESIAGRAKNFSDNLRAMSVPAGSAAFRGAEIKNIMDNFETGGMFQARNVDRLIAALVATDGNLKNLAKLTEKYSGKRVFDGIYEAFISNLFWDLTIHKFNMLSSGVHLTASLAGVSAGAAVGELRRAMSKNKNLDAASFGEAKAYAYGLKVNFNQMWENMQLGYRMGVERGTNEDLPSSTRFFQSSEPSFGAHMLPPSLQDGLLGAGLETYAKIFIRPTRGMISSVDQVYRELAKSATGAQIIYRILTTREKLEPYSEEFNLRARLIADGEDPKYSHYVNDEALEAGAKAVFQNRTNSLAMRAVRLANEIPGMRYLTTFAQTIDNMFAVGLEYSPLSPVFTRHRAEWNKGGAERDIMVGKVGLGSLALGTMIGMQLQQDYKDKDTGAVIRHSNINTGNTRDFAGMRMKSAMGRTIGHLSIPVFNKDSGKYEGENIDFDLNRMGVSFHTVLHFAQITELALLIRDPATAASFTTQIAASLGDMLTNYSAMGGFTTVNQLLSGRIGIDDTIIDVWSRLTPFSNGMTQMLSHSLGHGSEYKRQVIPSRTGATKKEVSGMIVEQWDMEMESRMINFSSSDSEVQTATAIETALKDIEQMFLDIDQFIPAAVAKYMQIVNPFTNDMLVGNSSLDPEITVFGTKAFHTSPNEIGITGLVLDEYISKNHWADRREPIIYAEFNKNGYAPQRVSRVMTFDFLDLDGNPHSIDVSLDVLDYRAKKLAEENGVKDAEHRSITASYTRYAEFAGKIYLDGMEALINTQAYTDSKPRNRGLDDRSDLMTKETTRLRAMAREQFLADDSNAYIVEMLKEEVIRQMNFPDESYILNAPSYKDQVKQINLADERRANKPPVTLHKPEDNRVPKRIQP
jgi:hypothetical protein